MNNNELVLSDEAPETLEPEQLQDVAATRTEDPTIRQFIPMPSVLDTGPQKTTSVFKLPGIVNQEDIGLWKPIMRPYVALPPRDKHTSDHTTLQPGRPRAVRIVGSLPALRPAAKPRIAVKRKAVKAKPKTKAETNVPKPISAAIDKLRSANEALNVNTSSLKMAPPNPQATIPAKPQVESSAAAMASGELLTVVFQGHGSTPPPSESIFITGCPSLELTQQDFANAFADIGAEVARCETMPIGLDAGVGAFVQLASIEQAQKVIDALNGKEWPSVALVSPQAQTAGPLSAEPMAKKARTVRPVALPKVAAKKELEELELERETAIEEEPFKLKVQWKPRVELRAHKAGTPRVESIHNVSKMHYDFV